VSARISGAMELTDFPVLENSPFEALDIQADKGECGQDDDSLDSIFFPLVVLWFCSPT
jgi:hypothetical protein